MKNIFLTGFMGTGKSAVGQELAARLGWKFVDTDTEIEREAGISIPEIFRCLGEENFREREEEIIRRVASGEGQVVATGGGAVISPVNREEMRRAGLILCLEAPPETILDRVKKGNGRPLLEGHSPLERIRKLLQERRRFYREGDLFVDTSMENPEVVAGRVLELMGWKGSKFTLRVVRVNLIGAGYNIFIQPGLLSRVGYYLPAGLARKTLVVTDSRVGPLYGPLLEPALEEAGYSSHMIEVPEGEGAKSLTKVGELYHEALAAGLDRRSPILALGGGVVGDLAGFVAATYMRGVPFIQVPTTLLAQVDSSVGGKVAVNLPQGKNLVGSFYQPEAVYIDPSLLGSLPLRELQAGLAEVVKYAAIFSPDLFARLEEDFLLLLNRQEEALADNIACCVGLKAKVVEEDELDKGKRMLLNFGHTIGHALEAAAGYGTFLHGEAVALGMVAACRLSVRLGLAPSHMADRMENLLEKIGLPTRLPGNIINKVYDNLVYDKKAQGGEVPFILLQELGQPVLKRGIVREEILAVLRGLND